MEEKKNQFPPKINLPGNILSSCTITWNNPDYVPTTYPNRRIIPLRPPTPAPNEHKTR